MRQISAFPIRIIASDPPNLGTLDAALFGTGENGLDYCIKTVEKTPHVPAAELICHHLAEQCGIPVPQFDIVVTDGKEAFGSVWDPSAVADRTLVSAILFRKAPGKQIAESITRIFVLDMFVHNVDRHAGNYLCVGGRISGHSLKAFDFSRAFTANGWPLPALPMNPLTTTIATVRALRKQNPLDVMESGKILDRIEKIPFDWFKSVVEAVPKPWLERSLRRKLLNWWSSGRMARAETIREGMKNAALF